MTRYSKQVQMTNQSGSWVSFSSKVKLQQLIQPWCWAKFIAAAIAHLAPTASVSCPHCTNGPRRAEMLLNHVRMAGNSVKSVELKNYTEYTESRNVKNIAMEFQEPARLLTSQYFRAFTAIHSTSYPNTKQTQTLQKTDANQHLGLVGNCIQNQQNANDSGWFYCCIC